MDVFDEVERDIAAIRLPLRGRVAPAKGVVPWLVVDDDGVPVEPVRRFLGIPIVRTSRPSPWKVSHSSPCRPAIAQPRAPGCAPRCGRSRRLLERIAQRGNTPSIGPEVANPVDVERILTMVTRAFRRSLTLFRVTVRGVA